MDISQIKEEVKSVLKYSQDFRLQNPKVDALIEDWYAAKKYFIDRVGDDLIYEYPETIYFEMNEADKIKNVEDFITHIEYQHRCLPNIQEIIRFFDDNKMNFYTNRTVEDFTFEDWYSEENITIAKGIKIGKALKFFIQDKDVLTDLQMAVSRVIQKDKVKGKLCLSIHPLDYLSSSENNHNWRSCHALDGEYSMGNLSYMVDESTVICYLKSEEDTILPNFPPTLPWNNKKGSGLIHFSNDREMIFSGRQYPFSSNRGLDLVLEKLLPPTGLGKDWTKWDNTFLTEFKGNGESLTFNSPYVPINNSLIKLNELVKCGEGSLNYNDVLYSNYYTPYYSYCEDHPWYRSYTGGTTNNTRFEIGKAVKCLCCEHDYITLTDIPRCIDCEQEYGTADHESFEECAECGERVHVDNAYYVEGVGYVCETCFYESGNYVRCDDCGYMMLKSDAIQDEDGHHYCRWCARERNI